MFCFLMEKENEVLDILEPISLCFEIVFLQQQQQQQRNDDEDHGGHESAALSIFGLTLFFSFRLSSSSSSCSFLTFPHSLRLNLNHLLRIVRSFAGKMERKQKGRRRREANRVTFVCIEHVLCSSSRLVSLNLMNFLVARNEGFCLVFMKRPKR